MESKPGACPWCGETNVKNIVRPGMNGRYFIDHVDGVLNIKSQTGFDTVEEAVTAWNKGAANGK